MIEERWDKPLRAGPSAIEDSDTSSKLMVTVEDESKSDVLLGGSTFVMSGGIRKWISVVRPSADGACNVLIQPQY